MLEIVKERQMGRDRGGGREKGNELLEKRQSGSQTDRQRGRGSSGSILNIKYNNKSLIHYHG